MIERNKYLNILIKNKNNGFPKVITGIRRCGKSYLLNTIYKEYLLNNGIDENSIIILELDDDKNINYRNPIELGKYIRNKSKNKKMCYVFIDEIQLVDTIINPIYTDGKIILSKYGQEHTVSFVDVVLGLSREKNIDLYVTGSNSKMLSSDVITEFRDKATNIHIQPLSFEEYYNYVGGSKNDAVYEYLQYGGMPLSIDLEEEDKKQYLINLFKLTYLKDILDRNKLQKIEVIDELCNIISECAGQLINSEKISNVYITKSKEKIDKHTIDKYISLFEDSFLLSGVKRYDVKGNREIGALRKYYFVDNGLRNARLNFAYTDEGQMLENMVYNELVYNGYTINVGVFDRIEKDKNGKSIRKDYEIDFIAKKGIRKYYIQVCCDMNSTGTRQREIKPYRKLNDQIQKIIVINKPINETRDEYGFTIIGVADFLLRFIK